MATLVEQFKSISEKIDSYQEKMKSGKPLTPEDVDDLDALTKKAKEYKRRIDMFKQVNTDLDKLAAIPGNDATGRATHFDFRSLVKSAPAHALEYSRKLGTAKGLVSAGSTILPISNINDVPIPQYAGGEIPPRLLDYIPSVTHEPVYGIVQEIVPDGGDVTTATVVAPYEQKPVKPLKLQRVEQRLHVVAVLSEPIDKYVLEDQNSVNGWIGSRLTIDVYNAMENEILNGDGTGEHFLGLAHVTGTQTQAYFQTVPDTIAAACASLENIGVAPSIIALSAADWLAIQTLKLADGGYYMGSVLDPVKRMLWGHQVAVVPGMPAGTGWVIGANSIQLSGSGMVKLEWNPYSGFNTNTTQARVEGRFNLDVLKPHGLVKLTLTEPAGK